jgi:3-oxoacyl-[acyl-carrier protein] reductase
VELGLEKRTVLIAGASRGIGLACAETFLREGANVAITGRGKDGLEEARATLAGISGGRVLAIQGDMNDEGIARDAVERVVREFKRLDVAVASVGSGKGPAGWELTRKDWQAALEVNLIGPMSFATAAIRHFVDAGGGCVVFVSSIAGREAISAPIPYSAAKAAIDSAVKGYSRLLGGMHIRVNAVVPGNVLASGGSWERKLDNNYEETMAYIRAEVPLQQFAAPEDIANAVAYIASERARFITGACLVVDGGQTRGP